MDITTLIGIAGAGIVLFAFIKVQLRHWTPETWHFDFFNFLGSALLVVYGYLLSSWPFVILNLVWAAFSLKDLIKKD